MIPYVESSKTRPKKTIKTINEFSKVKDTQLIYISVVLSSTNNEISKSLH